MYPKVPKEMANIMARLLYIVSERLREWQKCPKSRKKTNVSAVLRKDKKEDTEICRQASLISEPGKTTEEVLI